MVNMGAAPATKNLVENDFHFHLDEHLSYPDNTFSLVLKKRKGRAVTSNAPLGLRGSQMVSKTARSPF
jgi:hypothetical protein